MTVDAVLTYVASFRTHWNLKLQSELLDRFRLDPTKSVKALSKGQRTQLGLITALCPEPELLVLDEPTSGLDPIIRREFIQTVIGAYQEADPERRTIFVSTHLITEFEGLIDEFTIIDAGRSVLHLEADQARQRYQRIRARFPGEPPSSATPASSAADAKAANWKSSPATTATPSSNNSASTPPKASPPKPSPSRKSSSPPCNETTAREWEGTTNRH